MAETQCTAPAETVESSSLAPEMTSDALTLELQAKADALVLEAEQDEAAQAAEPQKKDDNLAPDGKVRCAKCCTEGDATNFVCRASYRPELRYVCKPCQALSQTLMRNGICIDKVLSENEILYFFQQASEERQNSEHKRLAYSQARAMLKKTVLHEVRKTKAERADAEWQPLTFWELQGYDVQSIALSAPSRQHAVLGTVYTKSPSTRSGMKPWRLKRNSECFRSSTTLDSARRGAARRPPRKTAWVMRRWICLRSQ